MYAAVRYSYKGQLGGAALLARALQAADPSDTEADASDSDTFL